ncbi:YybH family protein [Parasedimentitalea huanghaiensis]|uniref:DUF4440 domain-containing protein n=1 Tax=Parasedimentitalea huanghaiensis TaxID=2682100 RepID=A0A6L6WCG8_9RHOB|nr:DUF4440 domain-containing protein [Zongyanglinia huanghaiensis]MVO15260.1 DUF4440 domain-containing protein [Zongyanglinia huanghaiensis]
MKHAFAWLMALVLSAPITLAAEGKPMTTEQQKVLETITTMSSAFMAKDIDGVMATYEDTATVMFEPGQPVSDPDTLRAMFTGMSAVDPIFEFGEHEVFIAGDTALHITPWQMSGRAPDGTEISQSGLSVAVLRRQPGGTWLMVIDNPHGAQLLASQGS